MIQTDTIIVNSTLVTLYVLTFYDGIKEEVDIKNNTIYLWHDEQENFETWLKIKSSSPERISAYLSNKIGIMDVINCSSVEMYKRSYDNYKELQKYLDSGDLDEIEFPENEKLGQDFLSVIHEGQKIKTTFVSYEYSSLGLKNVAFNQRYSAKMMVMKVASANDANIQLFETMAA